MPSLSTNAQLDITIIPPPLHRPTIADSAASSINTDLQLKYIHTYCMAMYTAYNHLSYCILVHNKTISFHVCLCYMTITCNRPMHALFRYSINNTLPLCSNLLDYPLRGTHQLALRHKYTPALPNQDNLQLKAQHFFNNDLAANTRYTYSTSQ